MRKRIDVSQVIVGVRGGGDIASGVAYRLHQCGFKIFVTEIAQPLTVRRTVSFSEAVYDGRTVVEGIEAVRVDDPDAAPSLWRERRLPVYVDPAFEMGGRLKPDVMVDAILAKKNTGSSLSMAPLCIALGPGFEAGKDAHYVIETNRGHFLGRVITAGGAQADTGVPGAVEGVTRDRVLRAPKDGIWKAESEIGRMVDSGERIGEVDGVPVPALVKGVLRGMIHDRIPVKNGMKIGDIDPRGHVEHCFTISEKALAVGGGVLEAILRVFAA